MLLIVSDSQASNKYCNQVNSSRKDCLFHLLIIRKTALAQKHISFFFPFEDLYLS